LKKIFISSDHAGFKLKEIIKIYLSKKKLSFQDLGPNNDNKVDYPDYAHKVAKKVKLIKIMLVF
jgi:ribose 5-phosphate isomerase B